MRILLTTQSVDERDPYTSFFVGWLREFSHHFDVVHVVCLKEGEHAALPANIHVYSLGKEDGRSLLKYVSRLFRYAWRLRSEYDAVFVHMNQEYVLLAGWFWKLLGKRVYLWRNHYAGSVLTDVAAAFCTKVFCTSKFSYTAKYKKAVLMPVGVDTQMFRALPDVARVPRSVLFFGRLAPSKHPEMLVGALKELHERGERFSASFYGSALSHDEAFRAGLVQHARSLPDTRFFEGVPNSEAPRIFSAHEVYVDMSPSGMYNKTLFEAAACGCIVLSASRDFGELAGERHAAREDGSDLAKKLSTLLTLTEEERASVRRDLRDIAEKNSLDALGKALAREVAV
jgi:glycosyltransferase involved in cell wall biosynthesis